MLPTRIGLISVHTCPLAALGGKETGGMNVYVREVARHLGRLGLEVDVFTRSQTPGVPEVVPLGPGARVVHIEAGPQQPMPPAEIVAELPEFIDGVEAFRRRTNGSYALLHGHYWLSGLVAVELARRWARTPVVQMFHTLGVVKNAVSDDPGEWVPQVRLDAEAKVAGLTDRIVAATSLERAELAWYCGAADDRVRTIPCGVDVDLFSPGSSTAARALLGLDAEWVLLFVGRPAPVKGLEVLLEALARLKADGFARADMRLVIVGGDRDEERDDERTRLRALADTLDVGGWVDFKGPQLQSALPDYYRAADLCLVPSHHETFGMAALEAMACGATVVASRVGGLATTIQHGITGVLVPPRDDAALAAAIASLLADAPRRRSLGRQATRRAQSYAWPSVARALVEVYDELVPGLGRTVALPLGVDSAIRCSP
jgi:D-inositol-3-phosphate glycosyltransferase